MKKIFLSTITLAATICMSASVFGATTVPDKINAGNMDLQWSDEFDGTELNREYWTPEIGNGNNGWGNNELEYYMDSDENIEVSDGTLKITAQSKSVNGFKYTSARLKTEGKVNCGYGYVEARIKLPSVNGIWPAFWMLGANQSTVGWPRCGEIDILEAWNTGDFAQNCMHYADDNSEYYETEPWRADNWSNFSQTTSFLRQWGLSAWNKTEWHTYGVYKTEEKLVFYYDGKVASRIIDITNPAMSEIHEDFFILLNVACGGNLASNIAPNAADLPASMEVDYVRYYTGDPTVEKTQPTTPEVTTTGKVTETTTGTPAGKTKVKVPEKAKIKSIKNIKGKKIKLTIKKVSGAKGFSIRYCENKKFDGFMTKNTKKRMVVIKKLVKKETYYVKVRAYKKADGKKVYGPWSKVKKVKIKK